MFLIDLNGLANGNHQIELTGKFKKDLSKEFNGEVKIIGNLKVLEDKYLFEGEAEAVADLVCDLSLDDFQEKITAPLKIKILKGAEDEEANDDNTIYLGIEEKKADVTEIILEELLVNLPMKKIAPKYRGKDLKDIYPDLESKKEQETDSTWEKLKKLKLN